MKLTQHQHDDAGSIVVGWMTKLALAAAIFGVVAFDGIAIGVGHFSATDDANNAIQAASQNFLTTHSDQAAYGAALATLNGHETIDNTNFVVLPDGTTTLTLTDTVRTLLLEKSKKTKGLAEIKVTITGKYTGS